METNLIGFNISLGKQKPENIIHHEAACPFCDREHLTGIIATDGDIILLRNKYNVLENADQFVIIEGSACEADMPDYSRAYMRRLIHFSVHHWEALEKSGEYDAVLFFKNYGPLSGGTIRHPHMQLIGCRNFDPSLTFRPSEFEGLTIDRRDGVDFNISTQPRIGFSELNVLREEGGSLDAVADYLQTAVDFLMHHFRESCRSYNIFFYRDHGLLRAKILPRFATSPLFIGYNIRLRPNNMAAIAAKVKEIYFS